MTKFERTQALMVYPLAGSEAVTVRDLGRPREPSWRLLLAVATPLPALVVVGMALSSDALASIAGLLAIALAVVLPRVGLVEIAFLAPLLGRPILPYPGLLALLIAAVILGCIFRLSLDRPTLRLPLGLAVILGFLLFAFFQQLPAMVDGYPGEEQLVGSNFLRLATAAGAVVAAGLAVQGKRPWPYLVALVISGCVASAVAIVMFVTPSATAWLGSIVLNPEQVLRPSGFVYDPNYFGMVLATIFVIALGLLALARGTTARVLALAALAIIFAGFGVAQSRSAVGVLLAALVLMALLHSKRAGFAVAGIGALVGAVAYVLLINVRLVASGGAVTDIGLARLEASDGARLDQVLQGPELFLSSPLFGVGIGHFVLETGDASHNWFSSVIGEQGLVGIVLMALFVIVVVARLRTLTGARQKIGVGVATVLLLGGMFLEPMIATQWSVPAALALVAVFVSDWEDPPEPLTTLRPAGR